MLTEKKCTQKTCSQRFKHYTKKVHRVDIEPLMKKKDCKSFGRKRGKNRTRFPVGNRPRTTTQNYRSRVQHRSGKEKPCGMRKTIRQILVTKALQR